jgi:broad specificity phosphatase PhoE
MPDFRKTLFIVRHAHRVVTDRSLDNGLSERGHKQAEAAALFIHNIIGPKPVVIRSSPRLRCQQTLSPLAKMWAIETEVDPLLCEQEQHENDKTFLNRIEEAKARWIHHDPERLIICSHGDWIPEFCRRTFSQDISLDKGGVIEAKLVGEKPVIFEIRQKLETP